MPEQDTMTTSSWRRPTPVPADRMARHDHRETKRLAQPMWLEDTRRASRYALLAGNNTGGVLALAQPREQRLPPVGQRLTLLGGRRAPVRFVVQVDDWVLCDGQPAVSVRWVLLSGPSSGGELERILRDILEVPEVPTLGLVDADATADHTRSRLVYQAERKTLRTLSTQVPSGIAGP